MTSYIRIHIDDAIEIIGTLDKPSVLNVENLDNKVEY